MASDPNIKLNSNGHRNNASQLRGTGYAPADPTLPPYSDPQGGLLAPPPQHIQNRHSHNLGATFNNENCEAPILNGPTQVQRVGNSQTTNNGATTNAYGGFHFLNASTYQGGAKHIQAVGNGTIMRSGESPPPSRMEALGQDAQQPQVSQRPAEREQRQDLRTQDSNQKARERDQIVQENRRRAEENRQRAQQRARESEQRAQEASQKAERKPAAPTPAPPPSGPRLPQQSTQAHPPSGPSAFARPTVPPPPPSLGPYNPSPKAASTRPSGARTYVPMPAPPPGVAGSNSSLGSGRSTPATPKTPVSAPRPSTYAYPSPSSISHSPTVRQPAPAVPPASYRYVDSHNIGPTWNTEHAKGPVFNGGVTFGGGASARQLALAGGLDQIDDDDDEEDEDEQGQQHQPLPSTQRPYMSPQSEHRPLGSPFQESHNPRGNAMGGYAESPRQHSEFLPQQYQHAPAPTQEAWNARARPPHPTSQMPPPPPQHQPQYPPEASTATNSPWNAQDRSPHPGSRPYTPPPPPEPYRGRRDYSSSPRRYEPVPPYYPPMMPGAVVPVSMAVPLQPIYVVSPGYPYQHYQPQPQPPPPPPYYGRPPSRSRSRGDYYEDRRYYRSRSPSRDRDYERSERRGTPFASPQARSSRRYLDSREPSPESSYRKSGGYPSSDDEEYGEGRRRPLNRQRMRMQNIPAGCEHCSSRGDDEDSLTNEGSVGVPIHIQAPTSTFNTPQTRRGTPLPPAEVPLQNRTPEGGPLPLLLSPQKAPVAFSASGEGGKPYMLQCTIKGVSSIHIQVG